MTGCLFSEPMRVETATQNRGWTWRLGLVGIQSENAGVSRFRVQKASALVLPHPERGSLNCVNLQGHRRPNRQPCGSRWIQVQAAFLDTSERAVLDCSF